MTCARKLAGREAGFSLIEVLVSLVIVSVGLLGIAKMQAVAYSSTGVASKRSLAAIEASSLASSMSANRSFWAAGLAPPIITITGVTITSAVPALAAPTDCENNVYCPPTQLAAYDLQKWAQGLAPLLYNDQITINCPIVPATNPVNCTIKMSWTETAVALTSQEAAAAAANLAANTPAAMQLPSYTLYVQP